ncbi:class II fructose-bisphosphate aldolase family protein [Streptomyces sp. N2-109]|uniref:Class II fructose-bisphosphate aldolase family protein n=1 Tax=Streptomyces gossypii TaxID=2883101 RepID=A0ABT2K1V2_9ACTN|nr:class II fructose-bisphosphate aldolase [Streptomyces gossypii]MCT2594150.1 class II fructose-bisphosphate aldolase family protein [Streptomyces gossypii]
MTLLGTARLMDAAEAGGHGTGAFNAVLLEQLEAVLDGAARARAPVVVQVSENAVGYRGALRPLAAAALEAIAATDTPASLHLDHATEPELIRAAVSCGVASVMYDGARLPWGENLATTREITDWCHERGVWVEAELGEVGGKDGAHAPGVRTDPGEAARFVAETGVDALAVAVGSSHAMTERRAQLDLELIGALREAVPVPLVLHGSSGVPDPVLAAAVRAGIRKVNLSTHLNSVFTGAVRGVLADRPELVDPRRYLGPAREAMAQEVSRILGVLGAAQSAARVAAPFEAPAAGGSAGKAAG